jgi:hypothetical protein
VYYEGTNNAVFVGSMPKSPVSEAHQTINNNNINIINNIT